VIAVIAAAAALLVPGFASSRRASNERMASTSSKVLSSAEADFRANDRDWNGVTDFWTGDVKGLYTMTPARVRGNQDPPIRLIELPLAASDGDGVHVDAGGENARLDLFGLRRPNGGYWARALINDQYEADPAKRGYMRDTVGTLPMGRCHNQDKFGFMLYPDRPSVGKYRFMINENNTSFRAALMGDDFDAPARIPTSWLDWPNDENLKSYWCKYD
jgi:type II secretory pathway pseudopilin PulG